MSNLRRKLPATFRIRSKQFCFCWPDSAVNCYQYNTGKFAAEFKIRRKPLLRNFKSAGNFCCWICCRNVPAESWNSQEIIIHEGLSWEPKPAGKSAGNWFPAIFLPKFTWKSAGNFRISSSVVWATLIIAYTCIRF